MRTLHTPRDLRSDARQPSTPQTGRPTWPRRSRPPAAGSRSCRGTPLRAGGRSKQAPAIREQFPPKFDKICEEPARDMCHVRSLAQIARAGVWAHPPCGAPVLVCADKKAPAEPDPRGPSSCPDWESGRQAGDDQGNRLGGSASFREFPGGTASGNPRPPAPLSPRIQPREDSANPC